ncbi:unnamed protein product [Peronospora effusa]|nr:unnamed protein product [Peronospora effusa]
MSTVPEYSGWGAKQGSKVRSWKNRYFILSGRELVYYSGAKSDGSGAGVGEKGRLRVLNVDYSPDRQNGLLIHGENKKLKMTTASAQESRLLFCKIKEAIGEHEKSFRLSQTRSVDEKMELSMARKEVENQTIETLDDTELVARKYMTAVRGGWVEKLGQRNKVWKKRYMSLANGMLEYRKRPMEKLSGEVNVTDVRYSREYSGALEIDFGSETLLGDSDIICIRTESIRDLNNWMCALCDAVGKPRLHSAEVISEPPSLSPTQNRQSKPQLPPFPRNVSLYQDNDKSRAISGSTQPSIPSDVFDRFSDEQVAAVGNRIKRGWLYEQGSNMSSWMLRYFVLSGNTLHHYKHVNTTSMTLGNVVSVTRSNEGSLGVHFDDGSTLNVYGETKADTESWYAALCKASWNTAENPLKRGSVSKEQEQEEEDLEEDNGFGGWLLKKGQHFKTWKRRYFVLERSRLAYSAAAGSEVLGSGVVFEVNVGDLRPFCLNVRFQNGRLLHVVAPTQEAFSKWFDLLRKASNLVESFLLQGNGEVIIGEEFDNDIVENVNDVDVEFTAEDVFEYDMSLRDGEGASLWIAAMQNKPEYDALSSSSSEQYDENVVEAEIVVRASEASSRTLSESQGCVGWLKKEGGNIKSWKQRYFTLHGSTLSYYKSEKGSLLRSVNVVDVAVHPLISRGLALSTVGGRKLIIQAESNEDYNRWFNSIQGAVSEENDKMTAGVAAPMMNTIMKKNGSSVELEGVVSHSGWLLKEGQRFKTWKKRFFTLKKSALIYYSEIGGVARGHGMVKGVYKDEIKSNTLVITFHSDKIMRVTAASEVEIKSWFQVFSQIHSSLSSKTLSNVNDDVVDSEGEDDDGESGVLRNRFDSKEYLNDAISNDTLMRLHDEEGKATFFESQNCTISTSRSFQGELLFDEEEEKEDMSLTIISAEYCRQLLVEDERVQEKRLAEKMATTEPPITGCTPSCCILM